MLSFEWKSIKSFSTIVFCMKLSCSIRFLFAEIRLSFLVEDPSNYSVSSTRRCCFLSRVLCNFIKLFWFFFMFFMFLAFCLFSARIGGWWEQPLFLPSLKMVFKT